MSQPEISYVLNGRWPTIKAFGIQVAKMCQGFKQAGAKIRLIVPIRAWHHEQKGKTVWELYGIRDRFRLIRLPSLDVTRLHLTGRVFFWIQQILFALCAVPVVVFRRGIVYSRDPFTLYALSFFGKDLYWEVHRMPENPSSAVYQRLFRRVKGFVVITQAIKDELIATKVGERRILVAPDGIDLVEIDHITARPSHGKHVALYAGQLLEWKGVDTLVRAAQLLDGGWHVIVVGGLPSDIDRLKVLDTNGRVEWIGYVDHAESLAWIKSVDVLVLPNRRDGGISERYTSPLKMFEYMAAGKPIVASDLPSIREVLNERNAILVNPDDPVALANGIGRASSGEVLATQARQDVEHYTWEHRAKAILHFIHELSH